MPNGGLINWPEIVFNYPTFFITSSSSPKSKVQTTFNSKNFNLNEQYPEITTQKMANSSPSSSSSSISEMSIESPKSSPLPSFLDYWKDRIFYPTLLGGIVGGAVGVFSKHTKVHGIGNISATYATNLAIVTGCYCGAREFVRVTRKSEHGDPINSAIGGLCSGAVLGRLQGGQAGAIRYSVVFAVVGTAFDFATLKLQPHVKNYYDSLFGGDLKLPEWSPIQILDEEAQAAKRAREEQLQAQRAMTMRGKES